MYDVNNTVNPFNRYFEKIRCACRIDTICDIWPWLGYDNTLKYSADIRSILLNMINRDGCLKDDRIDY